MLSKQAKTRIALNKTKRTVPGWKRDMRVFFISQLPPSQTYLSGKHLTNVLTEVGEVGSERDTKAKEIFTKLRTWTRHDWQAFIHSGDADYVRYVELRSRLERRRLIVKSMTQEQINRAYGEPVIDITGDVPQLDPGVLAVLRDPVISERRRLDFGTIKTFSYRDQIQPSGHTEEKQGEQE